MEQQLDGPEALTEDGAATKIQGLFRQKRAKIKAQIKAHSTFYQVNQTFES